MLEVEAFDNKAIRKLTLIKSPEQKPHQRGRIERPPSEDGGVGEVARLEYTEGLRGFGSATGAADEWPAREQGVAAQGRRLAVVKFFA